MRLLQPWTNIRDPENHRQPDTQRRQERLLDTQSDSTSLIAEPVVAQALRFLVIRLISVYWLCVRTLAWAH